MITAWIVAKTAISMANMIGTVAVQNVFTSSAISLEKTLKNFSMLCGLSQGCQIGFFDAKFEKFVVFF